VKQKRIAKQTMDNEAKRWGIQGGAGSTLVAVPKIIAALPLSFLVAK
jgi:hypothetical protein